MHCDIGVIVIGRNEGERLRECLHSVAACSRCVYVDSGSTDGSAELANSLGVDVVTLSTPPKFSAARARNAGARHLRQKYSGLHYLQMLDGDCVVEAGWLERARSHLGGHAGLAAVFGRRRERFPHASAYNRICDMEWAVQPGLVSSCGGDVMFRVAAFQEVNGFSEDLVAAEEPELCLRLRRRGWQIECINAPMTVHDVALHAFGSWWTRARRAGFAFTELLERYGAAADRDWIFLVVRAAAWSLLIISASLLLLAGLLSGLMQLLAAGALLSLILGVKVLLIALRGPSAARIGWRLQAAALLTISKLAQFQGICQYLVGRLRGRSSQLIEYKAVP